MRISDIERTRVIDELRRHCAAGRLDLGAYTDRVAEALVAETLADLDHALVDLPTMRIADPAPDPPLLAPGGSRRDRRSSPPPGGDDGYWPGSHRITGIRARLISLLSVLVLALGVAFLILAHWIWAIVLVVGWIIGVAQGRIRIGRRPPS